MNKTAVEWLYDEIKHIIPNDFLKTFEQAKAMEKEQIENAFNYGQFDLGMEADEYYNETFKSE